MDRPVAVAGAGIAGLAVLRALHQRDVPAFALERRSGLPPSGLAVNVPGNGIAAHPSLGLGDDLEELGPPVRRREYRNARGRLLYAIDEDVGGPCGAVRPGWARSRADVRGELAVQGA